MFLEGDQKRTVTKQKKKTKPTKVGLVALKMVNFLPKQNATYMSGTPLPILLRVLPLPPYARTYVRTYGCMRRHNQFFWDR